MKDELFNANGCSKERNFDTGAQDCVRERADFGKKTDAARGGRQGNHSVQQEA
jgi:hypothetical protein